MNELISILDRGCKTTDVVLQTLSRLRSYIFFIIARLLLILQWYSLLYFIGHGSNILTLQPIHCFHKVKVFWFSLMRWWDITLIYLLTLVVYDDCKMITKCERFDESDEHY